MKNLVIIPTYNEKENILALVREIFKSVPETEILVVDDGSPDGTGAVVKEFIKTNSKLHILENPGKGGLGKAYLQGFGWALNSHPMVIGSRYVAGGGTANWSWYRKMISRFGSLYSRLILGYPVQDWTGGFNGWRLSVLKSFTPLEEVPILFEERR